MQKNIRVPSKKLEIWIKQVYYIYWKAFKKAINKYGENR